MKQRGTTAWLSGPTILAGDLAGNLAHREPRQLWERALLDDASSFQLALSNLAGVDIDGVVVPTDRLQPITLNGLGHADSREALAMNAELVEAVRNNLADVVCVGALGPVEPILALGEIDASELAESYKAQIQFLTDAGVDAILCRSFSELQSLEIAIRASKEMFDGPLIAAMRFDAGVDGLETDLGASVAEMCTAMANLDVDAVGVDRTEFPDGMPAIVSAMRAVTELPIYSEPNAGAAELVEDQRVYPEKPADFAGRFEHLVEAGANLIAGGLGTAAPYMAATSRARQAWQRKRAKRKV